MKYWLMKSEPGTFSLQDLKEANNGTECWDGVRNYQARNFMRDEMKIGDQVLFYHSVTNPSLVGIAKVVREAYPDHTALDPDSPYYDPKSSPENTRWMMVDIQFVQEFPRPLSLKEIHSLPGLGKMLLLRKGMRLSIQPVTKEEYCIILNHIYLQS